MENGVASKHLTPNNSEQALGRLTGLR